MLNFTVKHRLTVLALSVKLPIECWKMWKTKAHIDLQSTTP